MAVPDFQSFFKPLLDFAADGSEHSIQEARNVIAALMSLSEEDMKERLPSGIQTKFDNRVAWAKSYFIQAQVLEASRRGHFKITQRGIELHRKGLKRIDVKVLNQYPEFIEFHKTKGAQGRGTHATGRNTRRIATTGIREYSKRPGRTNTREDQIELSDIL